MPDYPAFTAPLPADMGTLTIDYDGSIYLGDKELTVQQVEAARNVLELAQQARWALRAIDDAEAEAVKVIGQLGQPRFATPAEAEKIQAAKNNARRISE